MKEMIKRVPIPLCGVMLGLAALGNLLQSYSEGLRYLCGVIAVILLVLILLKIMLFPGMIKEDMKKPVMASVSGTFPMALALLSTYSEPLIGRAAYYIWLLAIALHIVLIVYFTIRFMFKPQLSKVFASYFIVYVGIAIAAVTAPVFEMQPVGIAAFWFGLLTMIILAVVVTARYLKYRDIPDPVKPLICIYAAPVSLCIAGYVQSASQKSFEFLAAMYIVACILYIFALIQAVKCLRLPFFPSCAAFTFPFVISAVASKQTMACFANMGRPLPFLQYVVMIETVIAVVFVLHTLFRFLRFLLIK